jgi:D-alanine-D-alanine ligase
MFGGYSVEHEVSVVSARGVSAAMGRTKLVCVPIGVTGSGAWLAPEKSREILEGNAARVELSGADDGARVVVQPGAGGLLLSRPGRENQPLPIDVLFPLVHGWGGEDGRLQGALDLAGVPFVGAGVGGSSSAMDKEMTRQILRANGLTVTPGRALTRPAFERDGARATVDRLLAELTLPLFVKPANGGSSVGIHRVAHGKDLQAALEDAFQYDRKLVVEQGVDAREIECAVLGNDEPEASGLGEIVPQREFYDYTAKYEEDSTLLEIPARLDDSTTEEIRLQALRVFRALDLCGFARIDFLVERKSGRIFVNEANTLPGFTPISMFPKLWEATGLAYPRLIERLVELAREQFSRQGRRRARRTVD